MWNEVLREKLVARTARVSVIGLGYVGLSLAVELAKAGLVVRGIDLDFERVTLLNRGESYLVDVPTSALARVPDELSATDAAPLMCAGITTFNSLRNSGARAGDRVDWIGGVYALQQQLRLPIHIGGKTALEMQGYAHFLPLGKGQFVWLFGSGCF